MSARHKPIQIEPVDFRPGKRPRPAQTHSLRKLVGGVLVVLLIAALAYAAWHVLTARRITLHVEPAPDHLRVEGRGLRLKRGEQFLLRPGSYKVVARKAGHHDLAGSFTVSGEDASFEFLMEKLPGRVSLSVRRADDKHVTPANARVLLGNEDIGAAPLSEYEVAPGSYRLEVRAERFLPYQTNLWVEGLGRLQELAVALIPAWAEVEFDVDHVDAVVTVNGIERGGEPLRLELMQGTHDIRFDAPDHKPLATQLVVRANTPVRLGNINMALADGILILTSQPGEALVTVDGVFKGQTPARIPVEADEPHKITLVKAGYRKVERNARLGPNETNTVAAQLEPIRAVVRLKVEPAGTELSVDGTPRGATPDEIELTTVAHEIEIRKEGYDPHRTSVTPKVGFPQELVVTLQTAAVRPSKVTPTAGATETPTGHKLKLLQPGSLTMGSSRREQGRRSNETVIEVKLTRPLYLGLREVTNREFREFKPGHNSGSIKMASLNGDQQAVANVSWEDAAGFCNWLSMKEGLPTVYEKRGERLIAKHPIPAGYRLPTEAEWAYSARIAGQRSPLKYPWGTSFPPKEKSGNYADLSVNTILANYLPDYDDDFEVSAPPGSFAANAAGLYDVGGNVAEWCHDVYTIYPARPGHVLTDPTGPEEGRFHVIRGASWKRSSISALRLSHRDYGNEGKNDVGFRVCRYADEEVESTP